MNQRRMLNTSIYMDEEFSSLSLGARLLFIGMITNADDDGRLNANPKLLKSEIFPLDDEITSNQVSIYLDEVAKSLKSVVFYEVDGKRYAAFRKWNEHQTIRADRKRTSVLPAPPMDAAYTQPSDNQPATNPQPNVGINEWNGNEVKLKEDNTAPPAEADDVVKNILEEKSGINYEFQAIGLDIFEKTGAPENKKSECMRIAKIYAAGHIMSAIQFSLDYPNPTLKWKMFLYKLNQLHIASKKKKVEDT